MSVSFLSFGQCKKYPIIPEHYSFSTETDYHNYEALVLQSLKWLVKNYDEECQDERVIQNAFVMTWLSGSPDVILDIPGELLPFLSREDLVFIFIHGMAISVMTSERNTEEHFAKGIEALGKYLNKYEEGGNTSVLQEIAKAQKRGKAEQWVMNALAENEE